MERKKIVWIILGGVAAIIFVVAFVMSLLNAPQKEDRDPTTGGGTITQGTATPKPSPTLEPEEEHNHEGGDALGSATDTFENAKPVYAAAAEGFINEYLKWDTDESAEDRAARIAPYVAKDSPLLTRTPGISLSGQNNSYGYKSQAKVTWIDNRYTGWAIPADAQGNQLFMSVLGNYEISQQATGGLQNTFWESSGSWTVEFEEWDGTSNPVIIDVREPAYTKG